MHGVGRQDDLVGARRGLGEVLLGLVLLAVGHDAAIAGEDVAPRSASTRTADRLPDRLIPPSSDVAAISTRCPSASAWTVRTSSIRAW